jgi:hypothetical protein
MLPSSSNHLMNNDVTSIDVYNIYRFVGSRDTREHRMLVSAAFAITSRIKRLLT